MEVQNFKHVCKFCKKSFPCGRSLGGHIRSHLPKPGYKLRENPKKTWRAVDHVDVMLNNSSFSSSSTEIENSKSSSKMNQSQGKRSKFTQNNSNSSVSDEVEEEQQEVVVAMCLIMLSQDVGSWGDNINITSSLVTPAESSEKISLSRGKNSKSMNKITQKMQGNYSGFGAVNGKKSEYSTNGYVKKESKSKVIDVSENRFGSNDENSKNLESKKKGKLLCKDFGSGGKITKVASATCGVVKEGAKSDEIEVLEKGFVSNDLNKKASESKRKIGQITSSGCVKKGSSFEEFEALKDGNVSRNDQNLIEFDYDGSKISFDKRSKFECNTCNKVFHSYQALGGHRASHKKLVGGPPRCSPLSKLEENDIASPNVAPFPDDRIQSQSKQEQELVPEMRIGSSSSTTSSKKVVQKHECPICFRVFPSGQALGGHKRSHLLVASNTDINGKISEVKISNNQSSKFVEVVERSSSTETKDLLDLNFPPPPVQDETTTSVTTTSSSTSLVGFMKPYWCVESTHKHEPLLGLISN